jgi:hypothetical protein
MASGHKRANDPFFRQTTAATLYVSRKATPLLLIRNNDLEEGPPFFFFPSSSLCRFAAPGMMVYFT